MTTTVKNRPAPNLADFPEVLTILEFAALFRLSRSSAYDYARRGMLPVAVIRCGRRMFVSKAALQEVLLSRKHSGHEVSET